MALDPLLNPDIFGMQPRLPQPGPQLPAAPKPAMPAMPAVQQIMETTKAAPKGMIGAQQLGPALEQLRGAEAGAEKEVGEADVRIEEARRKEEAQKAEVRASSAERQAQAMRDLPERKTLSEAREELKNTKFEPRQDNARDMAAMFSLMGIIGMVVGRGSAQNAMSAMNGMLEGYRTGQADVYKRQQIEFDKNFKALQTKVATAEKELQQAVELQAYDKEAGDQAALLAIAKAESPIIKEMYKRQGSVAALNTLRGVRKDLETLVNTNNALQEKADTRAFQERQLASQDALKKATMALAQARPFQDVRGQAIGLNANFGMPVEDIQKLGPKEIPKVSADLESALLTQDLANDIAKHPYAAGLVGSFISKIDRLIPSRYSNEDSMVGVQILKAEADKEPDKNLTEGEIANARRIAKKAVDVINARAMSASGGSRVLVSELNLQKGVIGLEALSPESAVSVYSDLAKRDVDKLKRYGISSQYVSDFKNKLSTEGAQPAAPTPAAAPQAAPAAAGGLTPAEQQELEELRKKHGRRPQ